MRHREIEITPTSEQVQMRKRLGRWLRPVLRQEVSSTDENGLQRAREAAKQGIGLVILYTHSAKRDGFDAAKSIAVDTPEFVDKPSVFVVAQHQEKWPLNWLQEKAAFMYPFLTTPHTIDYMKEKMKKTEIKEHLIRKENGEIETVVDDGLQYLKVGDGSEEYIELSREALLRGGTVAISFQGGRSPHLDVDKGPPTVALFLKELTKDPQKPVPNFGFLFVGVSGKGIKNFSTKRSQGLRLFRTAQLRFGPYLTLDELLMHEEVHDENPRIARRNVDKFVRRTAAALVPENYILRSEETPYRN
jgi:hypothetical protein